MKEKEIKKSVVLIPSAFNSKVMGDIEHFIKFYKNDFDVYVIWDKETKDIDDVHYINKGDPKAQYLILTSDYVIDAGSVNGKTKINMHQKRISVWHGIPYKKMFVDLDPTNVEGALNYDYGVDLMVSPSKFYTEEFLRKSMLYNGEILETAVSRTDSLYLTDKEKENLKDELGLDKDAKILLYAPTYRKPGKMSLPFNPSKLKKALEADGNKWIIVTKMHYLNTLKNKLDIKDLTSYPYVNNLLAISDMMITDYSSLFFDYSILDKPTIFYQYDKKDYADDRGFMFALTDYVDKKYIIEKEKDLYNTISKMKNVSNLQKVKKEFYPHQKKNSTESLVKKLNFNSDVRKTKDIIFLINELNQLGGVNNFVMNFARYFKKNYNSKIIIIGMKEFADNNDFNYVLDEENLVDIKVSAEKHPAYVKSILENTDGYIIACQFSAHLKFEEYLKDKNSFLMFHGNGYDVVNKKYYTWHLDAINSRKMHNYKQFLLLAEKYSDAIKDAVIPDLKDKVSYIENSFDFSNRKNYYKKSNDFAVLSRLDDDKNIFDIIKIFSNKKLNKDFKVHVYGDGKLKNKFIEEIKKNKLEKRVIVHGYVENKDEMYKDKQGLIMTSLSEGFGLIVLEAACYGVPVYIYESAVAVKDFENNNVINVVKTSDIDDYVSKLNKPKNFTKKDFDKIVNTFSNEAIFNRWIKLFENIENIESVKPTKKFIIKRNIKKIIKNLISSFKTKIKKIARKKLSYRTRNILRTKIKYGLDRFNFIMFKIKHTTINRYKDPLISLITPFYNNNRTLEAFLKSVKKSGYKNYEIILVNDGSEEDPSNIIKKYKKVKYFYKENEGPGLTRNFAVDKATGEYMFFIDSDDTMYKGTLNYLVDYAIKNNLDIVAGRTQRIDVDTGKRSYWFKHLYNKNYINTMDKRPVLTPDTLSTNKLYKTKVFKEKGFKFEPGLYEDKLFSYQLYSGYDKIGIIKNIIYNWLVYGTNTSITTTFDLQNMSDRIEKMKKIYDISENRFKRELMKVFINHDLTIFANNYTNFSENDRLEVYKLFNEFFKHTAKYIYLNDIYFIKKKELLIALINNDFERFNIVATYFSEAYKINILKQQEKYLSKNENKKTDK